jgi:hypothetical protein
MPNIIYVAIATIIFSNLYIVMVIVEESVTHPEEQVPILLLYPGGGIVKHVVRKEKIQTYLQM